MAQKRLWSYRLVSAAAAASAAASLVVLACRDDTASAPLCSGSIQADALTADAGSKVTVKVSLANLDDDVAASVDVTWRLSGGGRLDHTLSHLDLAPTIDPYGNPAGIAGSAADTILTEGPTGSYTVTASVPAFTKCPAASYELAVQVNGAVPDAGAPPDGGDAGATDAQPGDAAADGD